MGTHSCVPNSVVVSAVVARSFFFLIIETGITSFTVPSRLAAPPARALVSVAGLSKRTNRDYFRCRENTQRVQQWRQAHPGYWKKKSAPPDKPQEIAPEVLGMSSPLVTQPGKSSGTLQDFCLANHPAFIGLISMVTGTTLQEDIASTARKLEARGRDILGLALPAQSQNLYDHQTSDST